MTNFSELGLSAPLLAALAANGYVAPTPIQAMAIPPIMAGNDLVGIAQTGTGKTAAFALPILHRLEATPRRPASKTCRVLVLSPTRELASQIAQSFRTYGARLNLSIATMFGGVPYGAQIRAMARGLDILVATPGRLLDHIEAGHVDLSRTEVLVLDEVDQMLDLGFVKPIRTIVRCMPAVRQNLFFSATMPSDIKELAAGLLKNPVEVAVTPVAATADRVEQSVVLVEAARKKSVLVDLFGRQDMPRTIVFTRTKRGADSVAEYLERAGITAAAIHGNKSQGQRERALSSFRAGSVRALVATDVAARGIDIDSVSHVINYELPDVAERYVHRIGRTARAGAEGIAISLCDIGERGLLKDIEKLIRIQLSVEDLRLPGAASRERDVTSVSASKKTARPGAKRYRKPTGDRKPAGARPAPAPVSVSAKSPRRPAKVASGAGGASLGGMAFLGRRAG